MRKFGPDLALKNVVVSTPVVSGFSYPFLKLLVNKAQKSYSELFTHPTLHMESGALSDIGYVILMHINAQLQERFQININIVEINTVDQIISTAEELLKTFEANSEDLGLKDEPIGHKGPS